jgi:hypothetical protein
MKGWIGELRPHRSAEGIMANMLAASFIHGYRFGGGRGGAEFGLLLIGLAFAGVLVWAIQRSGKSTT